MIAILGALLGFAGSIVPEFFKAFQDRRDKAHELEILKAQAIVDQQTAVLSADYNFDNKALAVSVEATKTGIKIVDALNGLVRPVITFSFFFLYAAIKFGVYSNISASAPFMVIADVLWTQEDMGIFATILAFWFGNRAINKVMK